MIDLKRRPDESPADYEMRICGLKEILGKRWDEVAAIINEELGQDYTESRYRKRYNAAVVTSEHTRPLGSGAVVDTSALDNMTQLKTELAMERQKLSAEKLELQRQLRQQARFELFYDKVASAVQALPVLDFQPLPVAASEKAWVLTLADLHYGSTFYSENNCYSREVAQSRMQDLCGQVIAEVQKNQIDYLTILSLGDTIEGLLRMTDLKLNDIPVVDCVVEVSRLLAQFLNQLSVYCLIDFYAVSAANHSQTRPLGSKANELATEDLERIIINYIKDMLADNDRVDVWIDLDREYVTFDLFDIHCVALHGHQIKNLQSALKDLSSLHQQFYSYLFCAHFHAAQEIVVGERDGHNCEVLVSPSLIGSDPYSDKLLKGAKAASALYGFDREHGHISTTKFILN